MGFFSSIKSFFKSEEKPQEPQSGGELKQEEEASQKTASQDTSPEPGNMEDSASSTPSEEKEAEKEADAAENVLPDAENGISSDTEEDGRSEKQSEEQSEEHSEKPSAALPEEDNVAEAKSGPESVQASEEEPARAEAQPEAETLPVSEPEPQPEPVEAVQPQAEIQPEPEKVSETGPEPAPEPHSDVQEEQEPETREEKKESGGFLSGLKRLFGGGKEEDKEQKDSAPNNAENTVSDKDSGAVSEAKDKSEFYQQLMVRLREADSRLSVWLDIVLDGVTEAGPELNDRISFLLRSLEAPANEVEAFVKDFDEWLARMEYRYLDEFRSELQYRLSLALDLEDEEDERSRLFIQLSDSLAKTRAHFARKLDTLISSHGELDDDFWDDLEELFIMADLGVEAAQELTRRIKEKALAEKATTAEATREILRQEIRSIFARPRRIVGVNPPEVVLMIGVNGAGKTTTIAKLAYRDRMQGKKVMIAAADTFRAAAIDQMRVWAERVGTLFHAKQPGSDPASVAFEAMDRALAEGVDVLYVDTAGRLQTKVNLMDELSKIRAVLARKHPGSPHRTVLVLDATTGQNALSQAKLFKEAAGVDELILTKLDGTAKGGVAIAVAMQYNLPISYVGMGEKVEDLRPFNGDDYADALFTGSVQD